MPIKPENRARYPSDWKQISERVRFERAEGRCECRGECGVEHIHENWEGTYDPDRCAARHGDPHPVTRSTVVLTVAHLDHTPENNDDENLRAMCQRCHNRYDAPHRRQNAARTRRAKSPQGEMFDE